MRFKFVFSAEWPSLPQCLALCLNIIIHSFFLRTLLVSFFVISSLVCLPLPLLLLLGVLHLLLLLPLLPFRRIACGVLRLHELFFFFFFSCHASLSSILEAATWSSSSVFTSFYLKDVQFSSSGGFSLGPVVAAGSVF